MTHFQPGDQTEVLKGKCRIKQAPCKSIRTVLILAFEIQFINALQCDCKTWSSPFGNIRCLHSVAQIGYMWAGQRWARLYFCHCQLLSNILRCLSTQFWKPSFEISVTDLQTGSYKAVRCYKRYCSKEAILFHGDLSTIASDSHGKRNFDRMSHFSLWILNKKHGVIWCMTNAFVYSRVCGC